MWIAIEYEYYFFANVRLYRTTIRSQLKFLLLVAFSFIKQTDSQATTHKKVELRLLLLLFEETIVYFAASTSAGDGIP